MPGIPIGNRIITYYALLIVAGMMIALAVLYYVAKKEGEQPDFALVIFLWVVPIAVLFTRLFWSVPRAWNSSYNPHSGFSWFLWLIDPSRGGLTIIGGITGGTLGVYLCARTNKKSFTRVADMMPFSLLIAQSIGRWGNFINQELFGLEITNPSWQWFPWAVEINGRYFAASFFYESFFNLLAFGVFAYLFLKHREKFKPGSLGLMYIAWYTFLRAMLEFVKYNPATVGGVGAIQLLCFIVCPIMIALVVLNQKGIIRLETRKARMIWEYQQKIKTLIPIGVTDKK